MPAKTHRRPLRRISAVVLVVLLSAAVLASFMTRSVLRDQEDRLLQERTAEAGLLVSTLFSSPQITLPLLGYTTDPKPGSTVEFLAVARAMRGAGSIGALSVGETVEPYAVSSAKPNVAIDAVVADLARRAVKARGMVSAIANAADGRHVVFAVAAGAGRVLYQEFPLEAMNSDESTSKDNPFSELDGVLYAADRVDPDKVIFSTVRGNEVTGRTQRSEVKVGDDTWLVVAKANRSLLGGFADRSPEIVLIVGIVSAILSTMLVETLARRRRYAMALVEERTVELRAAVAEQERLEQGQRHARELAESANRAKSEFLSRMSHELRTPLNAILGFGQLLELDELSDEQSESVNQIVKGGRHLLALINEILDISRIETGTMALSPEPVEVAEVLDDAITLMRPLADHRNVRIVHDSSSGSSVHVLADRQRLKQIVLNLVANAVKYNVTGGRVTVAAESTEAGNLQIAVTDTGPGIAAEDLANLFVPFHRLGAEQTDVEGAGIGLALSLRLAEAMGGTIVVESTVGKGSRFAIELPVVEGPLERFERTNVDDDAATVARADAPTARHKILYIEDNVSNIRLVERILAPRSDVEILAAMQGRLGITLAQEHKPALILLDVHLPDMNGDAVLAQLRDDPLTAGIPVFMVSADATSRQIDRLLAEGANGYMTKPIDVHELRTLIVEALDRANVLS